ncbi:MAG: hypothetical protein JW802_05500 [Campylobacterales bacterium]|nr:hypothetical protein [Campylobacterales bacterium]MBN2832570.1 hypothetical protein [Campylobacterales bacterium]
MQNEPKYIKLHQNVDTLKYHLYPSLMITSKDITFYNLLIDKLLGIKTQSQTNRNQNKSVAQFQHDFKGFSFQVSPSTVRGFSVTIQNADVTIHLKKITITCDQNPFSKVEFRSSFLQRFGYLGAVQQINKFLKENIISAFQIKISEIHLQCDIQGYTFSVLDFHRIKSRSRNNRYYNDESSSTDSFYQNGRKFQGFMRGGGDYLMRVYNKTKEIQKFPNKGFIQTLWKMNPHYDETKEVFRIEFQLRREKLKNMVINDEVLDGFEVILNNLNNIWGRCLDDFSLRDLDDKSTLEIMLGYKILKDGSTLPLDSETMRKRFQRSKIHPLWDTIKTFNGHVKTDVIETFKKPFTTDFLYVHNAFKAFLSTTLSHYGDILPSTICDAMNKVEEYTQKKHELTVVQDVYSKRLDRFNRLEKLGKDDEILYHQKHTFVNRVFDHIEESFEHMYHWDVAYDSNDYFIKKFQKFLGEAV